MADKLDRIISDYTNKRLDSRIKSIESRYLYQQKVDNLGIRTAYSGGSEQESRVLNKERLENDKEFIRLNQLVSTIDIWYQSLIDKEKIVIDLKSEGYSGLYWYQVLQYLDLRKIDDIGLKRAKKIYYGFKEDIRPFVQPYI